MGIEPPQPAPPPSMAERAIDTATDASRTIEEVTTGLKLAVDRLRSVIEHAQRPGQPLARLRATTREAPLTSLFIAFLACLRELSGYWTGTTLPHLAAQISNCDSIGKQKRLAWSS